MNTLIERYKLLKKLLEQKKSLSSEEGRILAELKEDLQFEKELTYSEKQRTFEVEELLEAEAEEIRIEELSK